MNRDILDNYIRRMSYIRALSSPTIADLVNAGEYSTKLKENFARIGDLAAENKKALEDVIFPFAQSEEPLSEEEIAAIRDFNDSLVDSKAAEKLDGAVVSLITDRLMRDAQSKGDVAYIVHELYNRVIVCHTFLNVTSRISTDRSISEDFRYKGLDAAQKAMEYLEYERFKELSDDAKYNVLAVTMIYPAFWGTQSGITKVEAHHYIEELERALAVSNDDFYLKECSNYDWDYYKFRVLGQYGSVLDCLYRMDIYPEDLEIILKRLSQQNEMWESDPDKYAKWTTHEVIKLRLFRAKYLIGDMERDEYRINMLALYAGRDRDSYDFDSLYINIYCVLDTILALKPGYIRERYKDLLGQYYNDVCDYVFRMSNGATLSEILQLYVPVIENYIEIPGRTSFEEMAMRSLAAFHPPTYVHSMMVAQISTCICAHLIDVHPELFYGIHGYETSQEVYERREELLNFTYHAALCHDFGKLPIIDTVFIYGRKLMDFELDIIRQHPDLGANLMEQHESTRRYADIARGHHKWYDNSQGYPEDFDTSTSQYKTIIDIVTCADCMDAATDSVGRSYNTVKTLDEFIGELRDGAGTRYAPYLPDVLTIPIVRENIDYILSEGRNLNYRNAYLLLSEVQKIEE